MSKQSKWDLAIKGIFSKSGTFFAATELITLLCEKYNVTRDHARQIIKRSTVKGIIKTSHPLRFVRGQYVYMGKSDRLNLETLIKITEKYKPPMYRVLSLMNRGDKIISDYEARKAAATPVQNMERYKLIKFDVEITNLKDLDIISIVTDSERGIKYIVAKELENSPMLKDLMKRHYEKMKLDSMILPDIIRWLKEHNFINSNAVYYRRSDNPSIGAHHNDFLWDGYSYTNSTGFSINTGTKDKQTLLVLDVLIHRKYSKEDLGSFYNRIQSVRNSTHGSERKILPVIFYLDINMEAKREINRLRILNFSLQNIFGAKVIGIISRLDKVNKTLSDSFPRSESEYVVKNIEESLNIMVETGHSDNFNNIKGDLFESLMYVVILNLFIHNSRTEHSKVIKPYEYDVIVQLDNEIIIIELKGFKNTTIVDLGDNKTNNTVKWFFGKTLPHAKKAYTMPNTPFNYDKSKVKACFITSAKFSREAQEWLEKTNTTNLKPEMLDCYYDGNKLLRLLKTHENLSSLRTSTGFVDLLERYYFKP